MGSKSRNAKPIRGSLGRLSAGRWVFLSALVLAAAAVGFGGGYATFSNMTKEFGSDETAIGVVGGGEGAILLLGGFMIYNTVIQRPSPTFMRFALWAVPVSASVVGATIADSIEERVAYMITPVAMTVAAEGIGYLARQTLIAITGVDAENDRRVAENARTIAFHRARMHEHPWKAVRRYSRIRSWMLLRKAGQNDLLVGEGLSDVVRVRLTQGASQAFADMYGVEAGQIVSGPELSGGQDSRTILGSVSGRTDRKEIESASDPETLADSPDSSSWGTDVPPDKGADKNPDILSVSSESAGQGPDSDPDTVPDSIPEDWSELLSETSGTADAVRTLRDKNCPPKETVRLLADTYPDWSADTIKRTVRREYKKTEEGRRLLGQTDSKTDSTGYL